MLADHELAGARLATSDVRSVRDRRPREPPPAHRRRHRLLEVGALPAQLHGRLQAQARAQSGAAADAALVEKVDLSTLLPKAAVEAYEAVDPGNARLRALAAETLGSGAWRLLWMPPALPYYERARHLGDRGRADAHQAPDLLELERRARRDLGAPELRGRAPDDAQPRTPTCATCARSGRSCAACWPSGASESGPAGMSTFALLYPCVALAELADPLAIARDLRAAGSGEPVTAEAVLAEARRRIGDALAPITRGAPTEGPEDERWYAPRRSCWTAGGGRRPPPSSGSARGRPRSPVPAPPTDPTPTATTPARGRSTSAALEVVRDGPPAGLAAYRPISPTPSRRWRSAGRASAPSGPTARVLGRVQGHRGRTSPRPRLGTRPCASRGASGRCSTSRR